MLISQTCSTTFRALLYISSKASDSERLSLVEISNQIGVSQHTLGKSLQLLVKNQLLSSSKGPTGGFYLTDKQQRTSLMSIVLLIDGPQLVNNCVLGLSSCSEKHPCPLHSSYLEARDKIKQIFTQHTIMELGKDLSQEKTFIYDNK